MFQEMVPQVGFGWTTRSIGFVLLASMVLPVATMQKRVPKGPARAIIDTAALREPAFILVWWSMLLIFAGLYIPYFYIEVFSVRANVFIPEEVYLNKYLIVFMNTGSLFGRLVSLEVGSVLSECCTLT